MRVTLLHPLYVSLVVAVGCGGKAGAPGTNPAAALDSPPGQAGPAPLRRLTQEQYRNTVRQLLGVTDLGTDLPVDEGTAGFFGNTIAPVSELHLEKYGRAAELVARSAVRRAGDLITCAQAGQNADRLACATQFV
jgi:hypothetical protein